MHMCSYCNILYLRFLSWKRGGLMDLVYGSSSSSYMDCEVIFVYECYRFAYMGFVSPSASASTPSSLTSSYMDVPSAVPPPSGWVLDDYPSYSLFLIRVPIISCCLLHGVPMVAEEVYCLIAPDGVSIFYNFFIVFYLLSSSRSLHRLSANLTARAYIRVVMLTVFVMTLAIFIICRFATLSSAGYQSGLAKVRRPWTPTRL